MTQATRSDGVNTATAPVGYLCEVLGENWVVNNRATARLASRYDTIVTTKQFERLQLMFRCNYTPEAARYALFGA